MKKDHSFVTDKAFETNSTITGMEAVNNIPLDEVFTEDPFKVALVDNGNINPAREISGIEQRNKITGAASYAAFMDSEIDLSKVEVKVQTSIFTDMINNYNFGKDKITFIPGTTGTLKGDTSTLQALIDKKGKNVSFLAIRLRDGAAAGYNVDSFYQSCSTIKTPLTLYAAQLIQQGRRGIEV